MHVGIDSTAGWGEKVVSHRAKDHVTIPSQSKDVPFVRSWTSITPKITSMQQVKAVMLKGERV